MVIVFGDSEHVVPCPLEFGSDSKWELSSARESHHLMSPFLTHIHVYMLVAETSVSNTRHCEQFHLRARVNTEVYVCGYGYRGALVCGCVHGEMVSFNIDKKENVRGKRGGGGVSEGGSGVYVGVETAIRVLRVPG